MLEALNYQNVIESADNANYGIFYCPECEDVVYLRKMNERVPHFYHYKRNDDCSICMRYLSSDAKWAFEESNTIIEKLAKNSTLENWFNAIDWLIKYQLLYRIEKYEWAQTRLVLYINNRFESLSKEHLIQVIISLIHIPAISIKAVATIIDNDYFTENEKMQIFSEISKRITYLSEEEMSFLIDKTKNINYILIMFELFDEKHQIELMNSSSKVIQRMEKIICINLDYTKRLQVYEHEKYKLRKFGSTVENQEFYNILLKVLPFKKDKDSKTIYKIVRNDSV